VRRIARFSERGAHQQLAASNASRTIAQQAKNIAELGACVPRGAPQWAPSLEVLTTPSFDLCVRQRAP
jgi:hypothetical protein